MRLKKLAVGMVVILAAMTGTIVTAASPAAATVPPAYSCHPQKQAPEDVYLAIFHGVRAPSMGTASPFDGTHLYAGVKWHGRYETPWPGRVELVYRQTQDSTGRDIIFASEFKVLNPGDVFRGPGCLTPRNHCLRAPTPLARSNNDHEPV
jgi:hypothetical protein